MGSKMLGKVGNGNVVAEQVEAEEMEIVPS